MNLNTESARRQAMQLLLQELETWYNVEVGAIVIPNQLARAEYTGFREALMAEGEDSDVSEMIRSYGTEIYLST